MHTSRARKGAAALSAALAAALSAMLVPWAAPPAAADPAHTPAAAAEPAAHPAAAGAQPVTLITGDRVTVADDGRVVGVIRAEGREKIPLRMERDGRGHTYVIPRDAQPLIQSGTVDRRLFDITELSSPDFRAVHGERVPFIVTYRGAAPAAKPRLHAAAEPAARRTLASIDGEALATEPERTAAAWRALTRPSGEGGARTTAPGIAGIALDGIVRTTLDRSTEQIGAPGVWQTGHQGDGMKIAVVDTGVDSTHPDLSGTKVVAEKNFSESPDAKDRDGHGTHVASTAAGTGQKSDGKYRGVAPKAQVINAKVLGDDGLGSHSTVVAGMEWAVAQGADVVNVSLGDADRPGLDPMEEAVNRLSAESDALFVVAAGNAGPSSGTVGSPGSADAALTVGAVDRQDALADFSSRGPRHGDSAVKPDLTAPGVSIVAALSEGSAFDDAVAQAIDGYAAASGTSMATPHVSGAAALLRQQHPEWSGEQLKAVLTASAVAGEDADPFQQGAGRMDLTRAVKQTVSTDPVSLGFGTAKWPQTDAQPLTKSLTYRNFGREDVTLALSAEATGPDGATAPEGMFTLAAEEVTVPAGGTAAVEVTADPRLGGERYGTYGIAVTAAGDGLSVRSVGALEREEESYDLTVKTIGRDGAAPADWSVVAYDFERYTFGGGGSGPDGTTTIRLPRSTYLLDTSAFLADDSGDTVTGLDWQVLPELHLTEDTTVEFDMRKAKPIELRVPDPAAELNDTAVSYDMRVGDSYTGSVWIAQPLAQGMRTGHVGPDVGDRMHAKAVGSWQAGTDTEYRTAYGRDGGLFTGLRRAPSSRQLAKLSIGQGSSVADRSGTVLTEPNTGDLGVGWTVAYLRPAPGVLTQYLNTEGVRWSHSYSQVTDSGEEAYYEGLRDQAYTAGKSYTRTFNAGVFGPALAGEQDGIFRKGNTLRGRVNPLADGAGHAGWSLTDSASTTLYRNGEEYATVATGLDEAEFTLPAERADYRLVTTVSRSGIASVSSTVTASYTFSSQAGAEGEEVRVPASAVRFAPELALDSTVAAGSVSEIPVAVQGSASGEHLKELTVRASFDGGDSWEPLALTDGRVTVHNPAEAGRSVSLRAELTDREGNALSQTIIDAYRTR